MCSAERNFCPVCFKDEDEPATFLTLSCDHSLCKDCANQATKAGLISCPLCRSPHILDTESLKERADAYRAEYGAWRSGAAHGSTGELRDISTPGRNKSGSQLSLLGLHSTSAGDLAVLDHNNAESAATSTKTTPKKPTTDTAPAEAVQHRPLGFAIVGMGRAGKIHLNVLQKAAEDATVRWLVDICPQACPEAKGVRVTADLRDALADPAVDCVIVSTPTPDHAAAIRAALEAGKHCFAEKPLCCDEREVAGLFQLAEQRDLLLHTAYNRRHDPAILAALREVRSGTKGKPLGATLVSRDYPYPPKSYLALSGNIFKDCVVHDLDYLTWLLDDEVASLTAHASTGDDPKAAERAGGMWEYSEVHLQLRSGATATLVNGRVSTSYEHRLEVYCEHGVVKVADPYGGVTPGKAFSDRFASSYHAQLAAFRDGVRAVAGGAPPTPNVDLARTMHLEELIRACHASVAQGGARVAVGGGESEVSSPRSIETGVGEEGAAAALRSYTDDTAQRVKDLYHTMRRHQSVEHVRMCRAKYCDPASFGSVRMSVWEAMKCLETFVDVSDPDVTLPNAVHAFQTAEGLRAMKLPDWLQLTGLIHDLGKMIYLRGCDADGTSVAQQWSIVGDTWVVGCRMPDEMVFPEFNADCADTRHPERCAETGIYEAGCGLDAALCAFGHDEYMYQVLAHNAGVSLPQEALYIIRYHSLYPWHDAGSYAALESAHDRQMKGWVKLFNQHDLYTKRNVNYSADELRELREYYTTLIDKYLPAQLDW